MVIWLLLCGCYWCVWTTIKFCSMTSHLMTYQMIALFTDYLNQLLHERQFRLDAEWDYSGSRRFKRVEEGCSQFVSWFGNSKRGGQFLMARGDVPQRWPLPDFRSQADTHQFQEARSAYFYVNKDAFCWDRQDFGFSDRIIYWFDSIGTKWLDAPDFFSDNEWSEGGVFTGTLNRMCWGQSHRLSHRFIARSQGC